MTEISKTVFEKYQVRKTKKQKSAFIDYVDSVAKAEGYDCKTEKGSFGVRNIVVGDPERAKVVYTAHYDTCAVLPFPNFITPKNIFIYLLYQIIVVVLFLLVPFFVIGTAVGVVLVLAGASEVTFDLVLSLIELFVWIALLVLMFAGPANKRTANDNTSGVTVLLDLMVAMPKEQRDSVAFIFFDLEEAGLFGSSAFASKHKNAMKDKLLVNFDCVSDGDNMIFAVNKRAKKYIPVLNEAFGEGGEISVEIAAKGIFYPSDQMNFKCGVGVAACRKKFRTLYLGRIHTPRDTVYEQRNVDYLVERSIKLSQII